MQAASSGRPARRRRSRYRGCIGDDDNAASRALDDDLRRRSPIRHPLRAAMSILASTVDTGAAGYRQNREAMLGRLEELAGELAKARAGGGPKYVDRHHAR